MALKLTLGIISKTDISRLQRELSVINDYFVSAAAHSANAPAQPPKLSRVLDQLVRENQVNLTDADARQQLGKDLAFIIMKAPDLHISFATEPPAAALEKILAWIRANIDQHAMLRVGLQPTIAAGCVLRTPNKIFDMSIRSTLTKQEPLLMKLISGAVNER